MSIYERGSGKDADGIDGVSYWKSLKSSGTQYRGYLFEIRTYCRLFAKTLCTTYRVV